ncbi:Hypothetical protein CINCED_3A016332 [Cinara cedri]|nr:Hypothetical protein CINCED_3A016332 [Cinara cedri]
MTPSVRFTDELPDDTTEQPEILRTDFKPITQLPPENNEDISNGGLFSLSPLWTLSTVILLCAIMALSYRGYLDTQAINYPFQGPKVIQKNTGVDQALWGTYRPGAYLGLRTKEPLDRGSVLAGLMWFRQYDLMMTESIDSAIRHMCDNSHKDLVYGYLEHDTVNYGHQVINDGKDKDGFKLQTIFLRPHTDTINYQTNTDWTTRIIYETNNSASSVSLIWYVYIDPGDIDLPLTSKKYSLDVLKGDNKSLATILGSTPSLTDFRMSIIPRTSSNLDNLNKFSIHINTSISSVWCSNTAQLKHCLAKLMILKRNSLKDPSAGSQIMLLEKNSYMHYDSHQISNNLLNNFMAVQITITHNSKKSSEKFKSKGLSYTFDVAYTQKNKQKPHVFINSVPSLVGNKFDLVHKEYSKRFQKKFEKSFPIKLNGIVENKLLLTFARVTFSNMAGSLGYFYGSSLVRDDDDEDIQKKSEVSIDDAVKYWTAGLLTAVPSRSQFPRGFLWDDGFHGLMLGSYDIELQLNILGHWMDLLNHQGWIPREQILGSEARSRVPEEFVVQSSRAANPPALLLTVDLLLKQIKQKQQSISNTNNNNDKFNIDKIDNTLRRLYPRLKAWYNWFNRTQRAINSWTKKLKLPMDSDDLRLAKKFVGYRWRGRDSITNKELNPKTLTSGMDDYPRSSHPVNDNGSSNLPLENLMNDFDVSERHVDLHCWMAHGARIMNDLYIYLKPDISNYENEYSRHFWMLVENLDHLHWTGENNDTFQSSLSKFPMYADYGVHTDDLKLVKLKKNHDYVRIVGEDFPKWRFVDSHIGYNALFPMFFRLVKNSHRLNAILDLIEGTYNNSSLLTKSCGIRSLSKSSPLYKVRNTLHDPPYWRGSVWINMQYLACSSLYYYANLPVDTESSYTNNKYEKLEPIRYLDLKTKQRCNKLYNRIRNDVIQCVYKEWLRTGYVWEQYSDNLEWDSSFGLFHKGLGTRPFTGWSANVVLLMAEIY